MVFFVNTITFPYWEAFKAVKPGYASANYEEIGSLYRGVLMQNPYVACNYHNSPDRLFNLPLPFSGCSKVIRLIIRSEFSCPSLLTPHFSPFNLYHALQAAASSAAYFRGYFHLLLHSFQGAGQFLQGNILHIRAVKAFPDRKSVV